MIARIQVRRDTAANWTTNDPILTNGEIGYETNTHKFKIGNNTSTWSQLNYELGQWNSDSSGNITYGAQAGEGNVTVTKNLTVEGDFTVNGTTTTINTEEVTIEDNMVVLNSNLTGAPPASLDAGIEVNLGTSGSQKFYWDQATSKWTLDADVNVLGDIYSNGTALWRLSGNDVYFTGGDVGIGTSSPSSKLQIEKSDSSTVYDPTDTNPPELSDYLLSLRNSYTGGTNLGTFAGIQFNIYGGNTNNNAVGSINLVSEEDDTRKASLCFSSSPSDITRVERMRIDSSGRVGIGTTSPDYELEVDGKIHASDGIHVLDRRDDGDITPTNWPSKAVSTFFTDDITGSPNVWDSGITVSGWDSTSYKVWQLFANSEVDSLNSSDDLYFRTGAGNTWGTLQKVWTDVNLPPSSMGQWTTVTNGINYSGGNVGIGTASPSGKLEVNTGAMSGSIKIGNFDNVDNLGNTEQFGEGTKLEFIADTNPKYSNHDTFTVAYVKAEYDGTGADTRTGDTALTFATYDGYAGSANGTLLEKMRISSSGNVGIGITSPTANLHVIDTTASPSYPQTLASFGNTDNNASLNIVSASNTEWGLQSVNSRDITFSNLVTSGSTTTRLMTIKNDGKVGIGITAPTAPLHVKSDADAILRLQSNDSETGSAYLEIIDSVNTSKGFLGYGSTADDNLSIWNREVSNIRFATSNSEKMRLTSGGDLGINNTNPSEKLDVVGNITATGTITSSSDITLKENIELISDPIEKVKEISGYTFNKKGEDLRLVGLVAQEVEKVLPEAVAENNEGLKSVAYGNLVALLVECVKKQDERIDQLEKTIEKLK